MKTPLKTSLVALAALVLAAAPEADAQARFGVKAGLNTSTFSGDTFDGTEPRLGFTGGAYAVVPFTPSLALQPEVIYSQKGVNAEDGDGGLHVDYVEVPVLVRAGIPLTATGLNLGLYAGPALAFKVSEEATGGPFAFETDAFKSLDVGGAAGATLGAGAFDVDLRYTLGLTNALEDGAFGDRSLRNGVFAATARYTF